MEATKPGDDAALPFEMVAILERWEEAEPLRVEVGIGEGRD